MTAPTVIAIDGPAASGKSTVGQGLANRLGYFYFDTGILYRAVALEALREGLDGSDEARLARLVKDLDVVVRPPSISDGRQADVLVDGTDVSHAIRTPEVDAVVSSVAASAAVRGALLDAQRRQVRPPGTVMVGRDIGTVVWPNADLKVFLTASAEERARRRLRQSGGPDQEFGEVLAAVAERDRLDASRSLAPLAQADDALVINTDGLAVDEVVDRIARAVDRIDDDPLSTVPPTR